MTVFITCKLFPNNYWKHTSLPEICTITIRPNYKMNISRRFVALIVVLIEEFQTGNSFSHIATNSQRHETELTAVRLERNTFLKSAGLFLSAAILGASTPSNCVAESEIQVGGKIQYGSESIMAPKAHGTTELPVQENLRFGASRKTADKICSFNRRFAEYATYYQRETDFEKVVRSANGPVTFYDR